MPTYTPLIDSVSKTVLSAYNTLQPETDADRQINDELQQHLRQWFSSEARVVAESAAYCVNRFVDAELDFETQGNRGMGRMTDYWARFGGKYRNTLRVTESEALEQLRHAIADQLLCGYLFAEYLIECESGRFVPREDFPDGSEGVLAR